MSEPTTGATGAQTTPPEPSQPIRGRVFKYGDDVNTDVIFPGKYTYTLRRPEELARHALEDLDPGFADAVRPGDVIVAGRNWGCGSSREQAVTCLRHAGVGAIVASSFARIFYRNAINNGLPAVVCPQVVDASTSGEEIVVVCPQAVDASTSGEEIVVDLERCEVRCGAGVFSFPPMSATVRRILEAGGLIPFTMGRLGVAPEEGR